MKASKISYSDLTESKKIELLKKSYVKDKNSFADIASDYNTYANKLRRDAKKFNIPIRNKSEAQKNALKTGKHKHPTKGTTRTEETKRKIGMGVLESWDSLDSNELEQRKETHRKLWNEMSDEQKQLMKQSANEAIRTTSKVGSKLEKFLLEQLIKNNIDVKFHQEQSLVNTKLQIDLYLPKINLAIEVDGPSHFSPVWGQDTLKKTKTYDNKKEGLILGKGMALVRIKQTMDFSVSRSYLIFDQLLQVIEQLSNKFPDPDNRVFHIKDN